MSRWFQFFLGVYVSPLAFFGGCVVCILLCGVSLRLLSLLPDGQIQVEVWAQRGERIKIHTPEGNVFFVDAGSSNWDFQEDLDRYPSFFGERDLLLLTHAHHDHIGGVGEMLPSFRSLLISEHLLEGDPQSQSWEGLQKKLEAREGNMTATQGVLYFFGDTSIEVLWPPEGYYSSDLNDMSLVSRVCYREELCLLLTGDMTEEVERELLLAGADLKASVLKVGHQGSRTSSSPGFLSAVRPRTSLLGVSEGNQYGHPHLEVVGYLNLFSHEVQKGDILRISIFE